MSRIAAEAVVILFLIIANGVFAMSEIAVVSARRARLQRRADAGDRRAAAALALATDPNDFLATVQVGITLVGILAGVFGGATIAEEIAAKLDRLPHIAPHGETLSVAIVVAAITYLSVVIGELVPKRIALSNPEGVARLVSKPMRRLARWSRPLIALLTGSANGLMRLMPIRGSKVPAVTDEELTSLLALGTRSGAFHPVEQKMIRGVLALGDRRARMVMTRRQDVVWLDVTRPIEELQQTIREHNFSRFPVGS